MAAGQASPPHDSNLEATAALARVELAHLDFLLRALADRLRAIPGLAVTVTYHRNRLSRLFGDLPYVNDFHAKSAPIRTVAVRLRDACYEVHASASSVEYTIEPLASRRGEPATAVAFSEWLTRLEADIETESKVARESLAALHDFIVSNHVA
jgi:hypothetical protein